MSALSRRTLSPRPTSSSQLTLSPRPTLPRRTTALSGAAIAAASGLVLAAALNRSVFPMLLVGVLIFSPLENWRPRNRNHINARTRAINLAHATATTTLTTALLTLAIVAISWFPVWTPAARWFARANPLASLALIVVMGDIGYYWVHRAMHSFAILWRFHRIHHASEQLEWLSAARAHPIDQLLLHCGWLIPLHLLGAQSSLFVAYAVLLTAQTLLVHSNVAVHAALLRRVIVTPDFHHWHHAAEKDAWNHNYASQLAAIDWFFGTAFAPRGRAVRAYGIGEKIPASYAGQLLEPPISAVRLAVARLGSLTTRQPVGPVSCSGAEPVSRDSAPLGAEIGVTGGA